MQGLDRLVAKILDDSKKQADKIIADAMENAEKIVKQAEEEASAEKERIVLSAKAESERNAEQLILAKKLDIRNNTLRAKQDMMDRVLDIAQNELNDMPKEQYLKFLSGALKKSGVSGGVLLVPKKYGIKSVEEIEGAGAGFTLYDGDRDISGGYVLIDKNVEQNNTFASGIGYLRYELESAVMKTLF